MAPPSRRIQFLGLGFDPMGPSEAARTIAARARRLEPFAYVATPNVDHVVRVDRKPEQRQYYADAWLNLCDSRIIELFAEFSRIFVPAAPGSDIVETLFRDHIWRRETVVVIGGSAAIVDAMRRRYSLADVRWFDAPYGLKDDPAARAQCVKFIADNPAAFIFLAVGSPQQEMIAHETMISAKAVGVAICCGGSLEFLTGETKRAPGWMRANCLEWLHRLTAEPGRLWRRCLVDGPRILNIWRRWSSAPR